ncbi:MAG: FAD-binding oxidoreductase [Rhodobacteraceae bacterium]|nr:FAD-binding oxidoreductase [Paracoccaceae bacterium]
MIAVKKLPRDPGPAAWNCLLPEAPPPARVEDDITAEWIVIGAGFAGLSAARRLSQLCPGDRIVVLDAKRVAEGPAGRNSGFMIDLPHDLASDDYGGALESDIAQTTDNRRAIAFAAEMARDFGLSDEAFVQSGKINAAATAKGDHHNRDYAKHLSAMGEAHEMLDAAQMQDLTGIDYYSSGLFTPGAAMIQPAAYVRGVADGLRSNRVQIFEFSPALALHKDAFWTVKTPKGSVRAQKVILAVNGHLENFGFMGGRLMHVFTYGSMTRALTPDEVARLGGAPIWGVTPADPLGTTVRRLSGTGGDRIVVRNRFTFDPSLEVSDQKLANVTRDHDRAFRARFPMLEGVEMEHRWGGRLCLSYNNVQVVREVDDGLYAACCQNGLGTVKGTLAGLLAAEMACGVGSDALDRALSAPAPTRLPPSPLAKLGATARLRWGEARAGREL